MPRTKPVYLLIAILNATLNLGGLEKERWTGILGHIRVTKKRYVHSAFRFDNMYVHVGIKYINFSI